ncbi:molybdopterin-guanine dinucleotide biosynthesis protein B [Paenibacillus timonensis]|uniref:Molybdopterin-guanine dinucleotide biosynthesis protein B n=1 Tax=Paenibacillus timonensis TaxID=225915 RepID=A0ABW3S6H2_9BACL|nr:MULTISPECIES: molybdopterin-guanine dinucleotide biosynthesis protein B [Paenibacillus]MCH1639126.1 molybdopterin-guanine dinucleotide biosynthesis protein B [Paenibacillus timonensis]MDU2243471.1 molybdopterin-guanine dinucleotide biosynthesis protein B [Paenibacillus sp.]GJM80566.1 molybdopterin-guanine dinucleotide biosynthesis protein MobB [Paenibacillus sp. HMSSN-139]
MAPVLQIVGYKNSGKTTLITRLAKLFNGMNLRVAVIKHDLHGFDADREGTDSFRHRKAGAAAAAITSPWRTAIFEERETPLAELIDHFAGYDLILVEGFKQETYPKMVMLRSAEDEPLIRELSQVCAIIQKEADFPAKEAGPRRFQRDEIEQIAEFIRRSGM